MSVYSLYRIPEEKSAVHCAVFVLLKIIKALLLFHKGCSLCSLFTSLVKWSHMAKSAPTSQAFNNLIQAISLHFTAPSPDGHHTSASGLSDKISKPHQTSSQPHYYSSAPPQHSFRRDSIGEFLIHKGKYAAISPAFSPSCHQATHHLSLRTA